MNSALRKIFFTTIFNLSLFLILIIGIQNSSNKSKVNLLINESIALPIGFTIGISFITGSVLGSLLTLTTSIKKD